MAGDGEVPSGLYEGFCQGCDSVGRLSDIGLCKECAGKLERRQRDWEYSTTGYLQNSDQREALHRTVIEQHGAGLELIAQKETRRRGMHKASRRRRKHRGG